MTKIAFPDVRGKREKKKKKNPFTKNLYFQNLEKDGELTSHKWVWSQPEKRAETDPFREKTERQKLLEEQGNPWKE